MCQRGRYAASSGGIGRQDGVADEQDPVSGRLSACGLTVAGRAIIQWRGEAAVSRHTSIDFLFESGPDNRYADVLGDSALVSGRIVTQNAGSSDLGFTTRSAVVA